MDKVWEGEKMEEGKGRIKVKVMVEGPGVLSHRREGTMI